MAMSEFDDDTWTETTRMVPIDSEPPAVASTSFVLNQINGDGAPRRFIIPTTPITLGRSPEADIQIPSPTLSRKHVEIRSVGEECHVTDLGSSNGFFLNGLKVHSAVLRNGDTLQLGNILLSFQEISS